ncbi:MAG: malate synthase A, partial [bacterium]
MSPVSSGVRVAAGAVPGAERVLTPEALAFVATLHRRFDSVRRGRLAARPARRAELGAHPLGQPLVFPQVTAAIRDGAWCVAPAPADLNDRRVEITGPVDRKMMINALNSGARVFMAD